MFQPFSTSFTPSKSRIFYILIASARLFFFYYTPIILASAVLSIGIQTNNGTMYVHVYLVFSSLKVILTFMANYLLQGKTS